MADDEFIRVEGLDRLLKKLNRLGPKVYKPALAEGATHIQDVIREYPPRWFGPQPLKTFKQRTFFFWALKEGVIDVPYRRGLSGKSEALGRRWSIHFRDGGKTAIVSNDASYSGLVHREDDQTEYHRLTGWKTDRQVVREEGDEVRAILARHYRQAIRKRD